MEIHFFHLFPSTSYYTGKQFNKSKKMSRKMAVVPFLDIFHSRKDALLEDVLLQEVLGSPEKSPNEYRGSQVVYSVISFFKTIGFKFMARCKTAPNM